MRFNYYQHWVRDQTKVISQGDNNESVLVQELLDEDDELFSELEVIRDSAPVYIDELIDF